MPYGFFTITGTGLITCTGPFFEGEGISVPEGFMGDASLPPGPPIVTP